MKLRLAICLLLFLLTPLCAQISQSLVDADTLSVGARFQLILKADFPLQSVTIPDSLDGFKVLAKDRISNTEPNPFFRITISPLKTGALSFPPLQIKGLGAEEYFSNGFRINVLAVRAEQDTLLRDIKPLKKYRLQRPLWFYLILPLLILAFLIWILAHRKKKPAAKPAPILRTSPQRVLAPWENAIRELDLLLAEGLPQPGEYPAFHFRLSMILRRFLDLQYHIAAQEMTTFEIRAALRKLQLDGSAQTAKFLLYCDLVKFAKVEPDHSEIQFYMDWLRDYLLSFKPAAQEGRVVPLG